MAVDTLSIARDLRAAELPPSQAEAIAAAIGKSVSEGAATKADIELVLQRLTTLEANIAAKSEALEHRVTAKIEAMRAALLTWIVGVITAAMGILIAVQRLG